MEEISINMLIVDDDEKIINYLSNVTGNMGLSPDLARNGHEAIMQIKEKHYDLIISDIRMPEASGIEVLEKAKKMNPDTRVMLITGYADFETSVSALRLNADDYIQKPFKLAEIVDKIKQNIEKKRLVDENIQLHKNIKKKNEELEKALVTIKQQHGIILHNERLKAIGTMAAGVAHEINNPLVFISANVQTLERYISKMSEDKDETENARILELFKKEVPGIIEGVRKGIVRMTKTISSLKTFARSDSNTDEAEPVYVSTALEEALEFCVPSLKNICVNHNIEGYEFPVNIVKHHLIQAIVNLLQNASDAVHSAKNPEITIIIKTVSDQLSLTIKDNGTGIKKEVIEHIFDPFFTTKEVGRGTGIGLAITRSIIEKSGGTINVQSSEENGTMFTIEWNKNKTDNVENLNEMIL